MDHKMFCFQCEQTAGCAGCTGKTGVCGKTAEVAELQDQLTGALVGLSRAVDNAPDVNEGTWRLMIEGLFTTVTNVSFNEKTIRELIDQVHEEKARLVPGCSGCGSRCGRNDDYDMNLLWNAQEDIQPQIPDPLRRARHGGLRPSRDDAGLCRRGSEPLFRQGSFCCGRGLGYGRAAAHRNGGGREKP